MTTDAEAIDLPFAQAIRFFQEKARVPTKRWNDVWRDEHSRNFMVAGATSDALLSDFQSAIHKALAKGTTLQEFRKDFDTIVEKHGWAYNGSPGWRSRIIYETNLNGAFSAGRYMQLTEPVTLATFPYWQYVHSGSSHPRLQHLAWDGLTLRADDGFWATHYPPNGWHCGCRVRPLMASELGRMGKKGPDQAPPVQYREWRDKLTGKVHQVPVGIDPGFDYNPGMAAHTGMANVPVKTDPMKRLPGPGTPRAPNKGAPLPAVPPALQRFLEAPEGLPEGVIELGTLPPQVQQALGGKAAEISFSAVDVRDVDPAHGGVMAELVRNPTVVLQGPKHAVLLLRQSGSVWTAEVQRHANLVHYLVGFRRSSGKETKALLEDNSQVYGDADDLGTDDE